MNRFVSLLLALTIVVGYTGVPVFKMICLEDGHTSVSLTSDTDECHHEVVTTDCCKPTHVQTKPADNCCASANNFFKLNEQTEVFQPQCTTGHILAAIDIWYSPVSFHLSNLPVTTKGDTPPLLSLGKQPVQSVLQVFRI